MTRIIRPFEPKDQEYTIVDNVIFDYIMPSLSPNAWKVLCLILRKTRGWHKEWDGLAYSQIKEGTGIKSDPTVCKALNELIEKEFVRQTKGDKWDAAQYALNTTIEIEVENGSTIENIVDTTIENVVGSTIESKDTKQTMKQTKKQKERGAAKKTPLASAPPSHDPTYLPTVEEQLPVLFPHGQEDPDYEQVIQRSGWRINNVDHRRAMALFLEASQLDIPFDKIARKDWLKQVNIHLKTYGLDKLREMYPRIVSEMRADGLSICRPGSLTNPLAGMRARDKSGDKPNAQPTNSQQPTEHQKRIAAAFRATARNPGG